MKSLQLTRHYGVVAALVLLIAISGPGRAYAAGIKKPKKQLVSVRFLGRAPLMPVTSFGANYESYVAALRSHSNKDEGSLVKLVYRFLTYDSRLPASLLDYNAVHRFRAVREPECDQTVEAMLYGDRPVLPSGTQVSDFSFVYARNALPMQIPEAAVLPCYVVTPADYKGSKNVPAGVSNSVAAGKAATTAPAASKSWQP